MQSVAKAMGAGLFGLGLMCTPLRAQNSIPDAPKPQTLPQINSITPVAPATPNATPNAPLPNAPAPASDNGGVTPGSTLDSGNSTASGTARDTALPSGSNASAADGGGGAAPVSHRSDIQVQVNFVEIPFTVKDSKGSLVPGITPRDVRIYENGLRQAIRLFTVDPIPLSVALVIDQSVTFDTMKKINSSLNALQGAFTPYDEVSVYTYNNGVHQQTGFSGAQSTRVTYALERSKSEGREPLMGMTGPIAQTTVKNNLPVDPNTNGVNHAGVLMQDVPREYHTLNDAILTAAVEVAKAGRGRRRVIYVISDGKEYGSQAKEKEVIRFLQTNNIAVYATLVGDTSVPGVGFLDKFHLPLTMRDDVLPRYTDATGGECDPEFRPRSIETNFARLTEQVRTQYAVGYYSHEPFIDAKYRPVDVRVMRPNLNVIAKKGYYPSGSSTSGLPAPARSGSALDAPGGTASIPAGSGPTTPYAIP